MARRAAIRAPAHPLKQWALVLLGAIAVAAGFLTFWLPIPIGLPLLLAGLTLLLRYSPTAAAWILRRSRRSPRLAARLWQLAGRGRRPRAATRLRESEEG